MTVEPAPVMDTEFPNLDADVVAAYRNAPEHMRVEIIDGELFTTPRPGAPHASAATDLVIELGPPFTRGRGGPGGWVLLVEPTAKGAVVPREWTDYPLRAVML